jgi:hypothetical protein
MDPTPTLAKSYYLKRFDEKADNVIGIIKNCEHMKHEYHMP